MSETAAPDPRRYEDRDVRDDDRLYTLACAYLKEYTGHFDPLVEAKEVLAQDGVISVPMARKVLNCMRHDARLAGKMPVPQRPELTLVEGELSRPVRRLGPARPKREYRMDCLNTAPHHPHLWVDEDKERHACPGVLNGLPSEFTSRTIIKRKYAVGKHGGQVHITKGWGRADFVRNPYEANAQPYLARHKVFLLCTIGTLTDPYLLDTAAEVESLGLVNQRCYTFCARCEQVMARAL